MKFPVGLIRAKNTAVLLWKRHGATVLTVGGSVATVAGTVLACKATLRVEEVLAPRVEEKKKIEDVHNGVIVLPEGKTYTEQDYRHDILVVKTNTAKDLVKLYWPSALLIGGGIAMILSGHNMMQKRVAAAATGAAMLKQQMDSYRARVRAAVGDEQEKLLYSGVHEETVEETVTDAKGKETKIETKTYVGPDRPSPYARYFDETNPFWTGREDDDFTFLKRTQANLTHKMWRNNGHLFWNTMLEDTGFELTIAGQSYGCVASDDGSTDNYVDFGIFDPDTGTAYPWALEMYRREHRILVDYNLDGDILDRVKLEKI